MTWTQRLATVAAGLFLLGPGARAGGPEAVSADVQMLQAADVGTDGPALLEFFRRRTVSSDDWDKIKALVRRLGDNSFQAREKASADLQELGVVAVPLLRQALTDDDLEIVRRAEECLHIIQAKEPGGSLAAAAARLLAVRKTPGAIAALLGYAPFADDDLVAAEIRTTLTALVRDASNPVPLAAAALGSPWLAAARAWLAGSAEQALVATLDDRAPARRRAAAEALCQARPSEHLPALRKLLEDADPNVRLHVALALARSGEKQAVPVLIDLLAQLPQGQARAAEALLVHLARDQAPPAPLGRDDASRRQCRDAWMAWWRAQGEAVNLAKLQEAPQVLGYTLLVLLDLGRVLELDALNRVRWQIDGVDFPLDAQLLPGDRVLLAEHNSNRVTERNLKGEVLWEAKVDGPLVAQRLPNGHTFIATQGKFLELDRQGRPVSEQAPPNGEQVMKATMLPNREIACVTTAGVVAQAHFWRIDPTGNREPKGFPVNMKYHGGRLDVLPNGHVLVPESSNNRVVEYDADGKVVWGAIVSQPVAAVRLPNGNTLITTMNEMRAVEVDRTGKNQVWEYKSDTRVTRAFRR